MVPYPDFLWRLLFLAVYACVAKSLAELHQRFIHDERDWSAFHLMLIEQEQTTPTQKTQKQFKHIKKTAAFSNLRHFQCWFMRKVRLADSDSNHIF